MNAIPLPLQTPETETADPAILVSVSVVLPIFNEEQNIGLLLPTLLRVLDGMGDSFEILAVNDGSRDQSSRLLHAAARTIEKLHNWVAHRYFRYIFYVNNRMNRLLGGYGKIHIVAR